MNEHFYNGFIKRAQEYGLSAIEANDLYKVAAQPIPQSFNSAPSPEYLAQTGNAVKAGLQTAGQKIRQAGKGLVNSGLQTGLGQKILSGTANIYNRMPEAVHKPVQDFTANRYHAVNNNTPGFIPYDASNKARPVHIDSTTTLHNGQLNENISSTTEGTSGSPLSQLGGSLAFTGKLPSATISQGIPAYNTINVNNDNVSGYNIRPFTHP